MPKSEKTGDDPIADLVGRVIRLENDVRWLKKIVLRDHYLLISTLITIVLTLIGLIALFFRVS